MESSNLALTARIHLELLKHERNKIARQERTYLRLAFVYGIEVFEISRLSGVPVQRVRRILAGI